MDITGLWSLQCMMFLLAGAGAILKRKGILKESGKTVLTDAVLYFFLPCNIINSFRMKFDSKILLRFGAVLFLSVLVQIVSYVLSRVLYNKRPHAVKRVLQYATIVSNFGRKLYNGFDNAFNRYDDFRGELKKSLSPGCSLYIPYAIDRSACLNPGIVQNT